MSGFGKDYTITDKGHIVGTPPDAEAPTMGSETKRVGPFHVKTCEHGVRKCEQCVFEDWKRSLATPTPPADGEAEFSICVWCNVRVEWMANADRAVAESKLREHSARCPKHPAVQELAALRARPLPDDVRAVVEDVQRRVRVYDIVTLSRREVDTLLAHLQRNSEAPDAGA